MKINKTQQSLVFVTNKRAYKVFTGRGARQMQKWELEGQSAALKTNAWKNHVVIARPVSSYLLVMPTGVSITNNDSEIAAKFVDEMTGNALLRMNRVPLSSFIHAEELLRISGVIRTVAGERLLVDQLRSLKLPTGPSHGDLHRGNLLWIQGKLKVIDLGRFQVHSCPIFDQLHFRLSEAQRDISCRWLDMLLHNKTLIEGVAMENNVDSLSLLLGYALHRICNEGAVALVRQKSMGKYDKQLKQLFSFTHGFEAL